MQLNVLKGITMSELKKAKKKTWTEFSKFIRTRDCILTTGTLDEGICISCNKRFDFKQLQAGHLIPGRYNVILFDEEIVNAQCFACNMHLGGNTAEYYLSMVRRHNKKYVDELLLRKFKPTIKFTIEGLNEMRLDYIRRTKIAIEEHLR